MTKQFTTLMFVSAGWLFTPCAFGQFAADSVVTQIRIQSYRFGEFEWFLNEMRYQLQGDRYLCDSLVISRNYGYMTSEQRKADRKKNKHTGKFKRVKGLFLYRDNQTFPASEVKKIRDTFAVAGFTTQLRNFHLPKDVRLSDFGVTKEEIESYLQRRLRGRDSAFADSVRKKFAPGLILLMDSIQRCEPMCMVSSHGQTRYGITIFLRYQSGREERLTTSDRYCHMLPAKDFLALFPFLQRLPDDFYYRRKLFNTRMVCDIAFAYVNTIVSKEKCLIWER